MSGTTCLQIRLGVVRSAGGRLRRHLSFGGLTQEDDFCRRESDPDGVLEELQLRAVDGVAHFAALLVNVDALAERRKRRRG